MHLIALALSPAIALIWFIYARNAYRPERKALVALLFLCGMASTGPALVLNHMVEKYTSLWAGAPEPAHRVLALELIRSNRRLRRLIRQNLRDRDPQMAIGVFGEEYREIFKNDIN